MIEIHLSQHTDGRDIASAIIAGRRFQATSRNGAVMALARQLVEAGITDQPWRAVGADGGLVRMYGKGLHRLPQLTASDPDAGRPKIVEHEPFDKIPSGFDSRRSSRGGCVSPSVPAAQPFEPVP